MGHDWPLDRHSAWKDLYDAKRSGRKILAVRETEHLQRWVQLMLDVDEVTVAEIGLDLEDNVDFYS